MIEIPVIVKPYFVDKLGLPGGCLYDYECRPEVVCIRVRTALKGHGS